MALPDRDPANEDAFVASFAEGPDEDALIAAIEEVMRARRPRLAARLMALLPDDIDIEAGSVLDAARRAANLWLVREPIDVPWEEWADEWGGFRRRRRFRTRYWARRSPFQRR